MNNPGFIVEGKQEKKILERICPNQTIRKISNGHKTPLAVIAKDIFAELKSFNSYCYPVIVIFDRENKKRKNNIEEIVKEVRSELKDLETQKTRGMTDGIIFGIPDLTLETWILPFVDEYGKFTTKPAQGYDGERCLGKLENRLEKAGIQYDKAGNGVKMFVDNVDPIELSTVSPSFKSFYDQIKPHCKWYHRKFSSLS